MSKSLIISPEAYKQQMQMADHFVKSGALPKSENALTVHMKILAGYEMGLQPIESIKSFYFVNGSINIYGSALMRRLREHGYRILFKDEKNSCTATISKDDIEYTDTLTFEEAEQSGWTKDSYGKLKPAWREGINRKLKLRYGVTSLLVKTYVPEVLGSAVDIAEVAEDYPMSPELVIDGGDEEPVTEKQKETLKEMGIEFDEGLTKQQALELLTSKKEVANAQPESTEN